MRILAVIFWILAVICSGVGSRDTCVSKNEKFPVPGISGTGTSHSASVFNYWWVFNC